MLALRVPRSPWLAFGIVGAAVVVSSFIVSRSTAFAASPVVMSVAVAADLAVVVPLVYWFAIVRNHRALARTVIPVSVLGLVTASFILPAANSAFLAWARLAIAPAELLVIAYVIVKARSYLRGRPRSDGADTPGVVSGVLAHALGDSILSRFLAAEFAALYFGIGFGGRSSHIPTDAHSFPAPATGKLLAVLVPVAALESVLVHFLLSRWSTAAAWALTALSAYTMLWIVGHCRAAMLRPTVTTPEALVARAGLRCEIRVPWKEVQSVHELTWRDSPPTRNGLLDAASPGRPNVLVRFRTPLVACGLFGMKPLVDAVALRVVDAPGLVRAIHAGVDASCHAETNT